MMCREKRPGAVHPGLNFVQREQRAVTPAERLRAPQVVRIWNADSRLGLHRLHDEGRIAFTFKLFLKRTQVSEWHGLGVR